MVAFVVEKWSCVVVYASCCVVKDRSKVALLTEKWKNGIVCTSDFSRIKIFTPSVEDIDFLDAMLTPGNS